jgi:hypothetical protein
LVAIQRDAAEIVALAGEIYLEPQPRLLANRRSTRMAAFFRPAEVRTAAESSVLQRRAGFELPPGRFERVCQFNASSRPSMLIA